MRNEFIKRKTFTARTIHIVSLLSLIFFACFASARAQTNVFTYQGRLADAQQGANGNYLMEFRLFAAATGGMPVDVLTDVPVTISNNVFTVQLNFSAANAFDGSNRFLEIAVKRTANETYTTLTPRQPVTSAPYATRSASANAADNLSGSCVECVTDAKIASINGAKISGAVANATNAVNAANAANAQNLGGAAASEYLQKSGGAISGNLSVGGVLSGDGSGLTNLPSSGGFQWQNVPGGNVQAAGNRGYIANSDAAQISIRLPSSPNIGDIVRVTGGGAGGWRIAQNANQFIASHNFTIPDQWTPRDSNREWRSVASSADGTKLVAVAYLHQIQTSSDSGATWTPSETVRGWEAVASSADGTKLVAAVNNGRIYTSADSGATWTPRALVKSWRAVASSADGTKLAAAAGNLGQIYTSTDSGVTWTPRESDRAWSSIASSADGTKLVATEQGGRIYTSTDSGATWTPRESERNWFGVASSADGAKLVAVVFNGQIYTSTDSGATWTPRESDRIWNSVASSADGTKLVAAPYNGHIYVSVDSGATWTPRENTRHWDGVALSADGTKIVAGVQNGQLYTATTTTNIGTGGYLTGEQNAVIELQFVGGGKFIVTHSFGTINKF
ncbi:MAG TPA: sialidase family protein [Pyrinomonadaceae bacterium]|nr:sialidase family protein [Pyrinomonadaceae bacterium]